MNIVVDAMGGDNAPDAIVKGCLEGITLKAGFDITLLGDKDEIFNILNKCNYDKSRIHVRHCSEVVTNHDKPTKAIKSKKDSSLVVGFNMIKNKEGDVFISAGNTGAIIAGALLILGRIKGVDRPALTAMIPTKKGILMLVDVGSNTTCKPINYFQYAAMGTMYIRDVYRMESPRVGLINIGEEERKGTDITRKAYSMLSDSNLNFVGNVEGRKLLDGDVDIAVCDGFVGNVVLKLLEGVGPMFFGYIKDIYTKNIFTKISTLFVKKGFRNLKKKFDYEEHGGVPVLGVNGKVFKCHGSSTSVSIKNTIFNAANLAKSSIIEQIRKDFDNMEVEDFG